MKRIISLALILVMVLALVGCADTAKQDAIMNYVNVDLVAIAEIEGQMLESFESVSGDNYVDDETMYNEFNNVTAILARDLNNKATEIAGTITDPELLEVHKIYMDYATKFSSAINIMIAALQEQDTAQVAEANEKINESNNLYLDYNQKLNALIEANGLTFEE